MFSHGFGVRGFEVWPTDWVPVSSIGTRIMLSSVQSHKQKGSDTTEHRLFELSASQLVRGLRSTTEQRALSKDQGRNVGLHSIIHSRSNKCSRCIRRYAAAAPNIARRLRGRQPTRRRSALGPPAWPSVPYVTICNAEAESQPWPPGLLFHAGAADAAAGSLRLQCGSVPTTAMNGDCGQTGTMTETSTSWQVFQEQGHSASRICFQVAQIWFCSQPAIIFDLKLPIGSLHCFSARQDIHPLTYGRIKLSQLFRTQNLKVQFAQQCRRKNPLISHLWH